MELRCAIQEYAWGVFGKASSVSYIAELNRKDWECNDCTAYAELWMGTHPNGPSVLKDMKVPLSQYIEEHPKVLGKNITDKFGDRLSFLFKILSVGEPLSIQAHPNKDHAEILHKTRPEIYKDPNHKPEMALALTYFEALCGFRPKEEIVQFLQEITELRKVIGEAVADEFIANPGEVELKKVFEALMRADKDVVSSALKEMDTRIGPPGSTSLQPDNLFTKLCRLYPGDVGCFAIYLLNLVILQPGEAIFLGPNIIHAYLLGNCLECMACSDNVVRAGLTPKFKDIETLTGMLEYSMGPADAKKFTGEIIDEYLTVFNPPIPDFAVQALKVPSGSSYTTSVENSASILIVMQGRAEALIVDPVPSGGGLSAKVLDIGSIIFIESEQTITFSVKEDFEAFRALCL